MGLATSEVCTEEWTARHGHKQDEECGPMPTAFQAKANQAFLVPAKKLWELASQAGCLSEQIECQVMLTTAT